MPIDLNNQWFHLRWLGGVFEIAAQAANILHLCTTWQKLRKQIQVKQSSLNGSTYEELQQQRTKPRKLFLFLILKAILLGNIAM